MVKHTQHWEENSSVQRSWWAGQRPLLHWSPRRKPCPQLCLPPPPFWSAARLMLAGGTPNPDTPPLLLGSQRYLEQIEGVGRENKKITATQSSDHKHISLSWCPHSICGQWKAGDNVSFNFTISVLNSMTHRQAAWLWSLHPARQASLPRGHTA